ncbi:G protein [Xiburema virus]|uniref:G protein n=1 Tax=Xiburema virus TaxID=1272959 RepID=A0A059U0H0_9RHAB|nr:G protein [Xiburema virus]AHZ45721.1 G protein [Xiburema virus]
MMMQKVIVLAMVSLCASVHRSVHKIGNLVLCPNSPMGICLPGHHPPIPTTKKPSVRNIARLPREILNRPEMKDIGVVIIDRRLDGSSIHGKVERATIQRKQQNPQEVREEEYDQVEGKVTYMNWPSKSGEWTENFGPTGPVCPRFSSQFYITHDKLIRAVLTRPEHPEGVFVDGYLCEAQIWSSKCTKTWYFSYQEERSISGAVAEVEKCFQALELQKAGNPVKPEHPLSVCYWNAEHTESVVYHLITPHTSTVNPYTNKIVDPLFLKGGCSLDSHICQTSKLSVMWLRTGHDSPSMVCNVDNWKKQQIVLHEVDMETHEKGKWARRTILEGDHLGTKVLESGCRTKFCNLNGIRFDDSEWWTMDPHEDFQHNPLYGRIRDMISQLPICSEEKSKDIGIAHPNFETSFLKKEMGNMLRALRCNDAVGKILEGESITPVDLSALAPTSPGPGIMYKLEETEGGQIVLKWAHANYSLIRVSPIPNTDELGYAKGGSKIIIKEWTNTTIPGIQVGPNGILKKHLMNGSSVLLAPQSMLQLGELDPSFSRRIDVNHIKWTEDTGAETLSEEELIPLKNGSIIRHNAMDWIEMWVHEVGDVVSGWSSGIQAVISIFFIFVFVAALYKLTQICIRIKRRIHPSKKKIQSPDPEADADLIGSKPERDNRNQTVFG